jgi:hypothetical protein
MKSTRYVFAVDPGLATGLALFSIEEGQEPVMLYTWQTSMADYAQRIRWVYDNYTGVETVCERFLITPATAKKSQAPFSLEHIGILKQCMMDYGYDWEHLKLQAPADAKALFPDAALRFLGYWVKGGPDHQRDAVRHALLYLVHTGWQPIKLLEQDS